MSRTRKVLRQGPPDVRSKHHLDHPTMTVTTTMTTGFINAHRSSRLPGPGLAWRMRGRVARRVAFACGAGAL